MNSIHRVLYLLSFLLLFSSHNAGLANCGFLSFGTPVIESSGKVRVDVNYLNLGVTFQDFDVHVSFSSTQTSIDFTLTNASTGSGYSATQFGSNSRVVQITGQNFSFGSTITICKIYFELPAGEETDITFTRISNLISPNQGCTMALTSHSNIEEWPKPEYTISGKVQNLPYSVYLQDVELKAEDQSPISFDTELDITNSSGNYVISELEQNGDYKVSCKKLNSDKLCGISTADVLAVQRHIFGVSPFSEPWEFIAADVSDDQLVTALDVIHIRNLLLNGINLPKAWTFIPASNYATLPTIPWPFNEFLQFNNLSQNHSNKEFIAIKGGDVDGAGCTTPGQWFSDDPEESLIKSQRVFQMGNRGGEKGQEILIPLSARKFKRQSLLSMSLAFDSEYVEVLEILDSNLPEFTDSDYVINFDAEGTLDLLWFSMNSRGISLRPNEPLFYIKIRVKQDFHSLRQLVHLRTGRIDNRIYNVSGSVGESIMLNVEDQENNHRHVLTLNQGDLPVEDVITLVPNPFSDVVDLQFYQPNSGKVVLKIFDVAGTLVWEKQAFFEKGTATININGLAPLPQGSFFYQLTQKDKISSGKMLKVK